MGFFPPDEPIPVAASVHGGQIGHSMDDHAIHDTIPLGTADVFGNGPCDLFMVPDRLYPFHKFDDQGTPLYGKPLTIRGETVHDVITGPNGAIYGIKAAGKKGASLQVQQAETRLRAVCPVRRFWRFPAASTVGLAAYVDPSGRLHVYSTIAGQSEYRPPGDHHSASFIPYDGAGFWRGKIPRRILVHACFSSLDLDKIESVGRVGEGPGQFLFSVRSMTIVNLRAQRPPALVTTEKQSVLRYFTIDESTGALGPKQFVNNEQHVALRHPAINPSAKAIPDPKTGLSNLIVGEGGRTWFYRFSGKFAKDGSPIYLTPPKPVLAQDAPLTLANLPVISPGDLDGDGLVDLIAGNNAGDLLFVKNIGKSGQTRICQPRPRTRWRTSSGHQGRIPRLYPRPGPKPCGATPAPLSATGTATEDST